MKPFDSLRGVAKASKPVVRLMLLEPAKDAVLQEAIKSSRVMPVHQTHGATDYGTVGFRCLSYLSRYTPGAIFFRPAVLPVVENHT